MQQAKLLSVVLLLVFATYPVAAQSPDVTGPVRIGFSVVSTNNQIGKPVSVEVVLLGKDSQPLAATEEITAEIQVKQPSGHSDAVRVKFEKGKTTKPVDLYISEPGISQVSVSGRSEHDVQLWGAAIEVVVNGPVRLGLSAAHAYNRAGEPVSVDVTVLGYDGQPIAALQEITADVQVKEPSGQSNVVHVRLDRGESTKSEALYISERGISQVSVSDHDGRLPGTAIKIEMGAPKSAAQYSDTMNFCALAVIFFVNLALFFWIRVESKPPLPRNQILLSHGLWSGMWLMWIVAWMVLEYLTQYFGDVTCVAILFEDLGSLLLISSAVSYMQGWQGLKQWAPVLLAFFGLADVAWPIVVWTHGWHLNPVRAQDLSTVFLNTLKYSPSLCLVVFGLSLLAWSYWQHGPGDRWVRSSMVLVVGAYTLFQILIYQADIFAPGAKIYRPDLLQAMLFAWRLFFVLMYWAMTLSTVGVTLPLEWARRVLPKLGWLVPLVVSALLERWLG